MGKTVDRGKPSILVVDDDRDLGPLLRSVLAERSAVSLAQNWTDAKARLRERRFDLILLDVYLPDAERLEPLETIRAADPDYPVLLMSANVDANDVFIERAMRMGVASVLAKPFDMTTLFARIAELLPGFDPHPPR